MNIKEIFTELANHMLEGYMFHEQAMNYFGFLTLNGYRECQKHHYYSEIQNYRALCDYYLDNYYELLMVGAPPSINLIDNSLYKYKRTDLDTNTIRSAVRDIYKKWVEWEKQTKELLETHYSTLLSQGYVAAALKISHFLKDVEKELKHATDKQIQLKSIDYDIIMIQEEQASIEDYYRHKNACIKI